MSCVCSSDRLPSGSRSSYLVWTQLMVSRTIWILRSSVIWITSSRHRTTLRTWLFHGERDQVCYQVKHMVSHDCWWLASRYEGDRPPSAFSRHVLAVRSHTVGCERAVDLESHSNIDPADVLPVRLWLFICLSLRSLFVPRGSLPWWIFFLSSSSLYLTSCFRTLHIWPKFMHFLMH